MSKFLNRWCSANHSTSANDVANMFVSSTPKSRTWKHIFRRCQISHWTKLEAPYKECTVICTFLIKCSSLKIMKFFIWKFLFELCRRTLRKLEQLNIKPTVISDELFDVSVLFARLCSLPICIRNFGEPAIMTNFHLNFVRKKKVKIRVNLSDIISIT